MPSFSPVVMIGFDLMEYSVVEGGALVAMVNVESGIVLERNVVVTVDSSDGTTTGIGLQQFGYYDKNVLWL